MLIFAVVRFRANRCNFRSRRRCFASLSVAAEEQGSDKGLGSFPQTCEAAEAFPLVRAWRFSASAFGDLECVSSYL